MIVTKPVDLALLTTELQAAGVQIPSNLGIRELVTPNTWDLFMFSGGFPAELPPEAGPIVEAHKAPPDMTKLSRELSIATAIRTTDDQSKEIYRITCDQKHVYVAELTITAIDAVSGVVKHAASKVVFKRLLQGPLSVGNTTPLFPPIQNAAAAAWDIVPSVSGNDAILSVKGAAGRTIDWRLKGSIDVYAPDGLVQPSVSPLPLGMQGTPGIPGFNLP